MKIADLEIIGQSIFGERWQSALARALNVDDRTVRRWLSGESRLPTDIDRKIFLLAEQKLSSLSALTQRYGIHVNNNQGQISRSYDLTLIPPAPTGNTLKQMIDDVLSRVDRNKFTIEKSEQIVEYRQSGQMFAVFGAVAYDITDGEMNEPNFMCSYKSVLYNGQSLACVPKCDLGETGLLRLQCHSDMIKPKILQWNLEFLPVRWLWTKELNL